jgi:O-antigen/teichoic acid export membrane protein
MKFSNTILRVGKLSFDKDYSKVILISFAALLTQVLTNYVLGRSLLPDTFGAYRKLMIFASFSGVIHLGYLDGQYLNWLKKGRGLFEISNLYFCITFLVSTHLFAFFILNYFLHSVVFTSLVVIQSLLNNLVLYFQTYFLKEQKFATSNFLILLIQVLFLLLFVFIKRFIDVDYSSLAYINFTSYAAIIVIVCISVLRKEMYVPLKLKDVSLRNFYLNIDENIKLGFFILLSGLILLTNQNSDKLLLSKFYDLTTFGYYTFASVFVSIFVGIATSVANIFLSKIFLNNSEANKAFFEKNYFVIIIACFFISLLVPFFEKPFTMILPQYSNSVQFFYPFISCLAPLLLNNLVLFNLYKKYNLQSLYFTVNVVICIIQVAVLYLLLANNISLKIYAFIPSIFYYFSLIALDVFLTRKKESYAPGLIRRITMAVSSIALITGIYFLRHGR